MSQKKLALFIFLGLLSICNGAVLGLLDIFGFVDGRHTLSLTLLIIAISLLYFTILNVFVLNFAKRNRIYTMFAVSALFFATTFFIMSFNPILTLLSTFAYYIFLFYAYSSSVKRSQLFIKFSPGEIFFPTIKNSFLFLLVILSILAFIQSQALISQNSLIKPSLLRLFVRPVSVTVNQQVNAQIQSEIAPLLSTIPEGQRQQVMEDVLSRTITAMADKKTGLLYGFKPEEIPVQEAIIFEDGTIDLSPVFEAMLPDIAHILNQRIREYAVFAPAIVALLTFVILQPFILPIQLIENLITIGIFHLLIQSGFIRIQKTSREVEELHL